MKLFMGDFWGNFQEVVQDGLSKLSKREQEINKEKSKLEKMRQQLQDDKAELERFAKEVEETTSHIESAQQVLLFTVL